MVSAPKPPAKPAQLLNDGERTHLIEGLKEMVPDEGVAELYSIFLPEVAHAHFKALRENRKLVHYTSAEKALLIADSRVLWLRSAKDMNDYSEVKHGAEAVLSAFNGEPGRVFRNALAEISAETLERLDSMLEGLIPNLRDNAFISCLSEHGSDFVNEDKYGRLSMWRTYGKPSGVAVVIDMSPMRAVTDHFDTYAYPVSYIEKEEIGERLMSIARGIERETHFLRALPIEFLQWAIQLALTYLCVGTKHPGFSEEREWRICHVRTQGLSSVLERKQAVLGCSRQPQWVYEFPLDTNPPGLSGFGLQDVIKRVIIGPSRNPEITREIVIAKMTDLGIVDAESRVVISGIPVLEEFM